MKVENGLAKKIEFPLESKIRLSPVPLIPCTINDRNNIETLSKIEIIVKSKHTPTSVSIR